MLSDTGAPIRTFSAERAAKLRKDTNFCTYQLWHGVPGNRGEVGLKFLTEQIIRSNPALAAHYELITQSVRDVQPACQHEDSCLADYPLPEISLELAAEVAAGKREILKRKQRVGFGNLLDMCRHAAGIGPEPTFIDENTHVPDDLAEPVFIVQSEDDCWRLWIDLKFRERLEAGEITKWYARNAVYVCDAKSRKILLSKKLTKKSITGGLSWKPVVLTFKDEALERKLATVCAQVITLEPDKSGFIGLERVHAAVKESAPALNLELPDMPAEVLDGWLGHVCREHMASFPIRVCLASIVNSGQRACAAIVWQHPNQFICWFDRAGWCWKNQRL